MNLGFKISEQGSLDLLSLGALVHRLDPGIIPFRKATQFTAHVSGGEFNVAGNLADAFGQRTGIATAMVSYPIGDLIAERVRGMGVRPFYKRFEHDGTRGPNMATVYSDQGLGVRAPVVFYNRCNEAAGLLKPGDFDWKAIFAEGVRWFHSGGIFASLSETTAELVIEAMKAARAAGAICSFDLNYREKLWKTVGGMKRAHQVLGAIVDNVDVLVGNEDEPTERPRVRGSGSGCHLQTRHRRVPFDDPACGGPSSEHQGRCDHVARRFTRPTITVGVRWHG